MKKKQSILLFILFILFSACHKKPNEVQFYYWKQSIELKDQQKDLLAALNTQKMFVKFFDIDKSNYAYIAPTAKVNFKTKLEGLAIIPCVYITNRSFTDETNVIDLAYKTHKLVQDICKAERIGYKEIQFDCDWSSSSKEMYFSFLEHYQKLEKSSVLVTSTLRLHQLKYPEKTGVPPVKKVALMVYNLGNIKDVNETNSIFKAAELAKYINKKTTYPLPMDIALPIYSWAVVYRFEKLSFIMNNIELNEFANNAKIENIGNNLFKVKEQHYLNGNYLYKDDVIRYEAVSSESLLETIALFKGIKTQDSQLILFDLSSNNALNFSYEELKNISNSFY